jgi:hypothetical protein
MPTNDTDDALARSLDRALHELPWRRAPATLEARVLGELERRAALPWWRRSFSHWPVLARAVFLVICAALVKLALVEGAAAVGGVRALHESGALSPAWLRDVTVLGTAAGNLAMLLARTVPPSWAYQGVAVCAALYVVLFGLGALFYRTLYLQPLNGK